MIEHGMPRKKALIFLCAAILLSGCSRTVTYTYEPGLHPHPDFDHSARAECAKYGDHAVYWGTSFADLGRRSENYVCSP